jgi:2-hydroxychromene-2-carboxylate isomerase
MRCKTLTETVRAEYRDNTGRALAAGVFGLPFYAFAGELFWGQDRLDMLGGGLTVFVDALQEAAEAAHKGTCNGS